MFKVSISTIREWETRLKETGGLEKNELHRSFRKIDPEKLKAYVEEHPDAYQPEMVEAFGCSKSGIRDALKRHKITKKVWQKILCKRNSTKSRMTLRKQGGIWRTFPWRL